MSDATAVRAGDDEDLLLIAARAPVPGETKTRLGAAIGMAPAAALYRAFLVDLAVRFTPPAGGAPYRLGWAFSPPDADFAAILAGLAAGIDLAGSLFVPQAGADWGERQTNLLRWGSGRGFRRTVLVASDSPHLCSATIAAAFAALHAHDVVFGRVHDGGYYLIGVAGFHDVLSGVPMSTSSAADALAARADALGLQCAELAPTFDVDVVADLALLRDALAADAAAAPATTAALRALGLW